MTRGSRLGWLAAGLAALGPSAWAQDSYLLVVTGLSGEPAYAEAFHRSAVALIGAAERVHGISRDHIRYLAEDPDHDPARIDGRATRDNVQAAVARIAEQARPGDLVLILLLGHGSYLSGASRFNLPGPDLEAGDFSRLLDRLAAQRVAFVNAASASGEFVKALSGPNRVIVTATRSGLERNQTVFGEHFVQALAGAGADADKDGRVSILEAFDYARREVARVYQRSNRLQTEHALLDDDGDGVGRSDPGPDGPDGRLARRLFLAGAAGREAAAADPRRAELSRRRREAEDAVEALKARKPEMQPDAYAAQLERLLLDLALASEALRQADRDGP